MISYGEKVVPLLPNSVLSVCIILSIFRGSDFSRGVFGPLWREIAAPTI